MGTIAYRLVRDEDVWRQSIAGKQTTIGLAVCTEL